MLMPSLFTNSFMDDFFDAPSFGVYKYDAPAQNLMSTDVFEKEDGYEIDMNLPGFKKEDVDVEVADGYLTISASHNYEHDEKDKEGNFVMHERRSGSFKRSYDTTGIDVANIKASFENGVLTLEMPKLVEQKPESKHLEIQ